MEKLIDDQFGETKIALSCWWVKTYHSFYFDEYGKQDSLIIPSSQT